MRSRSNSGVRLDYYQRIVYKLIMKHQNPVTGLFPLSEDNDHAWIRNNIYCILAVWGLSMSYKKIADQDDDRAKTYELDQCCVKLMRGLLMSMMLQKDKVEKFTSTQNPTYALHAKYSSATGQTVVGDKEWGHLQIDAVSLYLLILAQMTASGLQIIFNLDEVAFVQNLVFYIEMAYCTPDYGIWERGDKTNHGLPELNASSIGMAKAALEAINELDLFGARGGPYSVIHVLSDETQKCQAVLQSMLPRESNSKEIDSGILSVIGFPAFAVDDPTLIELTREKIIDKLQGRYGCKRFLRDGHRTPKEDPNKLYYDPWELRMFEHIECEWPLFFCYLVIDYYFRGDKEKAAEYTTYLENIMVRSNDGMKLVPELYAVPTHLVFEEYREPGSQTRVNLGQLPFLWAQSLYVIGKLLQEGFLAPGELDPLNRRLCAEKKPDVVVQVVILAEDDDIKEKIAEHDFHVQTIADAAPIEVQPARLLSHMYTHLGKNKKLGLSGRKSRDIGILSTSKLYSLGNQIFAFTPQKFDMDENYANHDPALLVDRFVTNLAFLTMNWRHVLGRPTVTLVITKYNLDEDKLPQTMITTMKKMKSGYINGTRVILGNLNDFLSTSCITNLNFLGCHEEGMPNKLNPQVQQYLEEHLQKSLYSKPSVVSVPQTLRRSSSFKRKLSVKGLVRKTRSINVDCIVLGDDTLEVTNRSPSPEELTRSLDEDIKRRVGDANYGRISPRPRTTSEMHYAETEVEELCAMLRESDSLEEQGDILQYLANSKGLDYSTSMLVYGKIVTVGDLLKNVYEKACQQKIWGLVRHIAGMLGKRMDDLAKAVTDLLVRQKQITVGMPPNNEHTITRPLPEIDLRRLIRDAHGEDDSTAMLTQELLIYLAIFIRTEPHLFIEMLRLRVGLIIQVMAMELSRTLDCNGYEASEHLLNLSPFEMKNLLYHIISGKEFAISTISGTFSVISNKSNKISLKKSTKALNLDAANQKLEPERQGQWLRRRRLDGALNRVPKGFYSRVWKVLERCQGIDIAGKVLPRSLTQEMTSGELKFALAVETVLNTIQHPEYRQLVVEALMVLTLLSEHTSVSLEGNFQVEQLVYQGQDSFLEHQVKFNGDAMLCCAKSKIDRAKICGGAAFICQHFYDSAPSGSYGTMTYMSKALAQIIETNQSRTEQECLIT